MLGGTFGAAVYGGYFGAGMGVMLLAILGLALPDSLARTSGLRTVLSILINGVAAAVFLIHGGLAWEVVGLLAAGSLVGGWLGARMALAVPAWALLHRRHPHRGGHGREAAGLTDRRKWPSRPPMDSGRPRPRPSPRRSWSRKSRRASSWSTGTSRTSSPGSHWPRRP